MEGWAVVSIISSVCQLIDFSCKAVARYKEFTTAVGEVPKSFEQISIELPLLRTALQRLEEDIEKGLVTERSKNTLLPAIAACHDHSKELKDLLIKMLPGIDDSRWKKTHKAVSSLCHDGEVKRIMSALRLYMGTLTFYYVAVPSTSQPQADAKLCKIQQWLSAPDPSTNFQKALGLQQADTGLWFIEGKEYDRWKRTAGSPLWLYGIPGCGKTILSSTVLQDVLQYCRNDPGKVTVYFFFDFNDLQKQNPERMLRSLLCQLSQQSFEIPAGLNALFSSCENGQRQPSVHALLEALESMIQELPSVYIVLDALDECTQRTELLGMLETMNGWQLRSLHLLVTSRKERDIESSLEGFVDGQSRICLQSTLVDKDIQLYVRQRLSDDERLQKWKTDASITENIEITLMSGAKGMFRWAVCQLEELGKCVNRKMLHKALATLPPTLDATYDRILAAITDDYHQYAFRILQWLAFSARPLLIEEIAEVVAIDANRDPAFDRDEVLENPREALNICSSLITMPYKDEMKLPRVVELAHYSVKEYLLSDRIRMGKAAKYSMEGAVCHEAIATSCVGYLLQLQQPAKLTRNELKIFRLASYSANFWTFHAHNTRDRVKEVSLAAIRLFSENNPAYRHWLRLRDSGRFWIGGFRRLPETMEPLYCAVCLNLKDVVKLLLDKGADVNAQGDKYSNVLQAASRFGYKQIVELLLSKGADVNAQGGAYGNALQTASTHGYKQIVEMLLSKGADVNAQGGDYFVNALQAASGNGHKQIVELLLSKGADVNVRTGTYNTNAVQAAFGKGLRPIVELLLSKGADINAQGEYYIINILQIASAYGCKQIVDVLADSGGMMES